MESTPLEAAHLLRRAAARGRKEEAEALAELGLKGAVERLLAPPALPPTPSSRRSPGRPGGPSPPGG